MLGKASQGGRGERKEAAINSRYKERSLRRSQAHSLEMLAFKNTAEGALAEMSFVFKNMVW